MTLSIKVPSSIRRTIRSFVDSIFKEIGKDFNMEKENTVFAIHPGGPAIIDHIAEELKLTPQQVALSRKVLYENGNLSSCTLPYMFNEILKSDDIPAGTNVFAIAFGPGLTVSGLILQKT
jgi:predicted naringenin-chalcone synthase